MPSSLRYVSALALLPLLSLGFGACAQPSAGDSPDQGASGAMSRAQLEKEAIRFTLDLPYAATDNPRQRLDIYVPTAPKVPKVKPVETEQRPPRRAAEAPNLNGLPAIVFIHGGAWKQGDKADAAARVLPFVRDGSFAAVSVGYRLSDEAQWPAQLHDVKAAIRWLRANADDYGIDPERIALWGVSAGGHLALMAGLTGDSEILDGELGEYRDQSSQVAAVINYSGVGDIAAIAEQPSDIDRSGPTSPEALLLGGTILENVDRAREASPVTYATVGDPAVLTIHGKDDRTVPFEQAVLLQSALQKAGVANYLIPVEGAGHGGFPDEAQQRSRAFLTKVLYGMGQPVSTEALSTSSKSPTNSTKKSGDKKG